VLTPGDIEGDVLPAALIRDVVGNTICYLAALMSKQFTKRKKPAAPVTPEQKALERQRRQIARTLLKRRRRKSGQ